MAVRHEILHAVEVDRPQSVRVDLAEGKRHRRTVPVPEVEKGVEQGHSAADRSQIAEKGYDAWLDEDYVGVNEQNGHYRADIALASLPDGGAPCYLVCGPYNVVVNQPGTYSFPLEVFKHYRTRTYPVALPLTISTDDGYRDSQFAAFPVLTASRPRLALSSPPNTPPEYDICETPRLVITPTEIPLDQAVGTHVSIWCNVASAARRYSSLISREFRLNFCSPSDAEIIAAEVEDLVEIIIDAPLGTCAGTITITDLHSCCGRVISVGTQQLDRTVAEGNAALRNLR